MNKKFEGIIRKTAEVPGPEVERSEAQPVIPILVNLAVDKDRWMRDYAQRNHITRMEAIRRAIDTFIASEAQYVEAA